MFSEILKIIPKLDSGALAAMEKALSSRFTKVAKGFGKGLVNVLKGGGIAGAGLALVDKLLNPLKETQEAIDRTLKSSDDIVTNAKEFGTESGKLTKLVALAESTGLDQATLFTLINKFKGAVSESKLNPDNENVSAVRNFRNETDIVSAFFEFSQSIKKLDPAIRNLVEQQVFGERLILKSADFFQTDLSKQILKLGLNKISTKSLTKDQDYLGGLADKNDELLAVRNILDVQAKAKAITGGMISSIDASRGLALDRENQRIGNFKNLATVAQTSEKIMTLVESGVGMLGGLIKTVTPAVQRLTEQADAILKSPLFKFLKPKKDN